MKVALLEVAARFGEPAAVLEEVAAAVGEIGPVDLVLLPECSLTGYVSPSGVFDPSEMAEPLDGPTVRAVEAMAHASGAHVAAPLVERDGDRVHNAFVVVSPRGELLAHYRKRHPWYPEAWATPGDGPPPRFEVAGVSLALAICFDVHFLATESADVLEAVDALLFPSAWVDEDDADGRADVLGGLAARFGVAIANANWGPGVPPVRGQGRSRVVHPDGRSRILLPGAGKIRILCEDIGGR